MPTLSSSGTVSGLVINTPATVYNPVTNQWFSGYIDLSNMTTGDTTVLTISVIAKTAGSYIQFYTSTYSGAQTNPLVYFPPMPSDIGWKLVINQTAGTARTYDWRIYQS